MNVSAWVTELLSRHDDVLTRVQVEDTRAVVADGDGWLAAYDLFRDGLDGGWLTIVDLDEALRLANDDAFFKFSADVRAKATAALAGRAKTHA